MRLDARYRVVHDEPGGSTIANFVHDEIGRRQTFGPCRAIGVMAPRGRIIGGLVFHNWQPDHRYVEISGAGRGPWLTKPLLDASFRYASAFVDRVVFRTSEHNERARRTLEALGAVCTLIPALRGPSEGEYFCVIDAQEFGRQLEHGRWKRTRTPRSE